MNRTIGLIAALAAMAAGTAAEPKPEPVPAAPVPSKYPLAKPGRFLEVVVTRSAPPSIRFTRRFIGVHDGRPALCWRWTVMRSYPNGEDRPTTVLFAKLLPVGGGGANG